MGYSWDEGDLTSLQTALLGVGAGRTVYLVRDSTGNVTGIRAVDHIGNRENVVDFRMPMHREGAASITEAARWVLEGMEKLPPNYVVSMDAAGVLTRGTRKGLAGYASEKNGAGIVNGVGKVDSAERNIGSSRSVAAADSYGPGDGALFYLRRSAEGYEAAPAAKAVLGPAKNGALVKKLAPIEELLKELDAGLPVPDRKTVPGYLPA